jgi:1-aminocyclopropane-1-carboxylate deaminase/D-cysteine desulfhydrase-like pyridoxal-dependent ACC family enzyme
LIVQEHKSSSYAPRTYHNAHSADLTVAIAVDFSTAGERLTHKAAGDAYLAIPYHTDITEAARTLYREMRKRNAKSLNIAGNGLHTFTKYGELQYSVNLYVYTVLSLVHKHWPIEAIVSGGQTGTDLAGGVAAEALNIPCTMTFPKGFKQRFANGIDIVQSEEQVLEQVNMWVELLKMEVRPAE